MNSAIENKLDYYISQLRILLQNLEDFKNNSDPNQELGEKLVSEGIGLLAEEIFDSVTAGDIGEKWIRNRIKQDKKQQQKQFLTNQESAFYSILNQMRDFLKQVSAKKTNLTPKGNSNQILKKIAAVENYAKFETKIRKTITVLTQLKEEDLVFNSEIPQILQQEKSLSQEESYELLKKFEQKLRHIIEIELSKISSDWWKQRIPEDVRENALQRKKKNESPWAWIMGQNPLIDYIDFADYSKIISRRDNWKQAFSNIFGNKDELVSKLKELEPIRNAIMHSRNLNKKQIGRLGLYASDFVDRINRYEKSK